MTLKEKAEKADLGHNTKWQIIIILSKGKEETLHSLIKIIYMWTHAIHIYIYLWYLFFPFFITNPKSFYFISLFLHLLTHIYIVWVTSPLTPPHPLLPGCSIYKCVNAYTKVNYCAENILMRYKIWGYESLLGLL
jgi:hypothetical protein